MHMRKGVFPILLAVMLAAVFAGCEDDENLIPVITRIEASDVCGIAPLTVQFVVVASGGDPLEESTGGNSWLETSWNFGDGSTGRNTITLHEFTEPGDYTVVATVKDIDGDASSMTVPVTVRLDSMTIETNPDTSVVASWHRFDSPSIGAANPGSGSARRSGVVINEVLIFNNGAAFNTDANNPDSTSSCIELFNNSPDPISLDGWILSHNPWLGQDNSSDPLFWEFPDDAAIEAYEHELIWLDGIDNIGAAALHANFILLDGYSGTPEDFQSQLFLADAQGNHIDYVYISGQSENVSFGRLPDAGTSGEIPLFVNADLCGFTGEDFAYNRFEISWTLDDEFGTSYRGRRPSHTFTTADVGLRSIALKVFDTHYSITRVDTIRVEVLEPYDM